MTGYVKIADEVDATPVEIPPEDDGTLSLPTVKAFFPGTITLKFQFDGCVIRVVKSSVSKLYPPDGGWKDRIYFCVKRELNSEKAMILFISNIYSLSCFTIQIETCIVDIKYVFCYNSCRTYTEFRINGSIKFCK